MVKFVKKTQRKRGDGASQPRRRASQVIGSAPALRAAGRQRGEGVHERKLAPPTSRSLSPPHLAPGVLSVMLCMFQPRILVSSRPAVTEGLHCYPLGRM